MSNTTDKSTTIQHLYFEIIQILKNRIENLIQNHQEKSDFSFVAVSTSKRLLSVIL